MKTDVEQVHPDLERFRSELTKALGFRIEDDKLPWLADLLHERVRTTHQRDNQTYLDQIGGNHQEISHLALELSVTETYFMRNYNHFLAFTDLIQNKSRIPPKKKLRILSAGCSSGEEPYSLAITILEGLKDSAQWEISITAVDINRDVIEKAIKGRYSNWSFRETSDTLKERHFHKDGKLFVINDELKKMVTFEQGNLVSPQLNIWQLESFDIVFCRNVLMYFTLDAAREIVHRITHSLVPGGHLFLGHAESLRGLSREFHLLHTHGTFYYQRRTSREELKPADDSREFVSTFRPVEREPVSIDTTQPSWPEVIAGASNRIDLLATTAASERSKAAESRDAESPAPVENGSHLEPALDLLKRERFLEALSLLTAIPASLPDPDTLLLRAVLHISSGDISSAETVCEELLTVDELNAGAYYVMALCKESGGDHKGAMENHQIAAYLDSEFALPHLHLGLIARREKGFETARRELSLAIGLLAREDASRIVLFGGGFGREALIELCQSELRACGGTP
ncbi:MAG: CheR family methyltransferase [bacterium]